MEIKCRHDGIRLFYVCIYLFISLFLYFCIFVFLMPTLLKVTRAFLGAAVDRGLLADEQLV